MTAEHGSEIVDHVVDILNIRKKYMSLKYIVDSLDGVDSSLHSFYTEKDGKFVLQIEGGATQKDVDELKASLIRERNEHKQSKAKLEEFAEIRALNIHPSIILKKLDRYDELEAAAGDKIDETKLEKMVETRLKSKTAPLERDIAKLTAEKEELSKQVIDYTQKERTRKIHDTVRDAASKAKIVPTAIEDVLIIAERLFDLDESGKVIAKDNVGVTPGIDPSGWFSEVQDKRPHWFPSSQGGGASGSGGAGFGGNNPFTADNWSVSKQSELYAQNPQKAEQLAKAAGTSVGGLPPVKK